MSISGLRATPLKRRCVTETGTSEQEITAAISDATCRHFRLTLDGIIEVGGRLARTSTGTVTINVHVKLPRAPGHATATGAVTGGHWHVSLILPGVNPDPVPPSYQIVVRYSGDSSHGPATAERRIRIESEPAGL